MYILSSSHLRDTSSSLLSFFPNFPFLFQFTISSPKSLSNFPNSKEKRHSHWRSKILSQIKTISPKSKQPFYRSSSSSSSLSLSNPLPVLPSRCQRHLPSAREGSPSLVCSGAAPSFSVQRRGHRLSTLPPGVAVSSPLSSSTSAIGRRRTAMCCGCPVQRLTPEPPRSAHLELIGTDLELIWSREIGIPPLFLFYFMHLI
ncbi:hypothetical protein AAHA92_33923 [Salvia divinorum]|uniref:Uncharacterized protein n=1 Tax=Salvia divinorum TaxID=28513 RepID=A0ABD1FHC8_SALDI